MNIRPIFASALPFALALAGCNAQVTPDYRGEPLATVQGSIVGDGSTAPAADVALIWMRPELNPDGFFGTHAPVSGQFPANFTLPIYAPPPDAALITTEATGKDEVGIAYIVAVEPGMSEGPLSDSSQIEKDTLGMSEDYALAYVDHELEPGSEWEKMLGGRPSPGYHLMEVVRKTPEEKAAIKACMTKYSDAVNACYSACPQDSDDDACVATCDTQHPRPDCGNGHDTFREAPQGFDTAIKIGLGPIDKGIDWY